jgi:serine/threonine-protein phosphatase 2A regulatory subunit A
LSLHPCVGAFVANCLCIQIAKAVDEEVVARDLVPAFVKLLKDNEAEVRTAIAGQIPGFCALVDRSVLLDNIMSSIEGLVSDSSQHVRAALGTQISGLAPILGKEAYVSSGRLSAVSH